MDIALVNIAALLALMLRFDFGIPVEQFYNYYRAAEVITVVMLISFYIFNLYNSLWRFASIGNCCTFSIPARPVPQCYSLFSGTYGLLVSQEFLFNILAADHGFVGGIRFAYRY